MQPLGDFSKEQKKNVLSIRSTTSKNKRLSVHRKINFRRVKSACDGKIIMDLNDHHFFKCDDGTFPSLIHVAVEKNEKKLIYFLLEHGVNLNVVEPGQPSLLKKITSCQELVTDVYLIRKVINAGVDVNDPELWLENCNSRLENLIEISPLVAELFIQSGVNLHPKCICEKGTHRGCAPLPVAVQLKRYKIINLLLERGVDINDRCQTGSSALMWAVKNNDVHLTNYFLNHGAFVNEYYSQDETVVHMAVKDHNLEILQILLSHEAINFDAKNHLFHGTVVHVAVRCGALNCIDFILDANPDVNLFDRENRLAVELDSQTSSEFQEAKNKLKKHLVRLRAAGFHLDSRNLAAVSGEEFDDLYAKCCEQVNSMKETKISPTSHVNFYDLLFISEQKLALCLEFLDDDGVLQSEYHLKFPLYAGMVQYKLNKAYRWVKLRESLNKAVYILLNNNLPTHIMEKIFSYFNVYELKKLQTYSEKMN